MFNSRNVFSKPNSFGKSEMALLAKFKYEILVNCDMNVGTDAMTLLLRSISDSNASKYESLRENENS